MHGRVDIGLLSGLQSLAANFLAGLFFRALVAAMSRLRLGGIEGCECAVIGHFQQGDQANQDDKRFRKMSQSGIHSG